MLLRRESVIALCPPSAIFDIAVLVRTLGHIIERRIGDLCELALQRGGGVLLLRFHLRDRGFQLRHLGHQRLRCRLVLLRLGLTDLLRGGVAARLPLLQFGDQRAALLVERQQALRQRFEPAALERAVEGVRIVANGFDIVHGVIGGSSVTPE